MAIRNISLLDIARDQKIGPIFAGANLNVIGSELGAPDYWEFGKDFDELHTYMYFGDVEVGFDCRNNRVKVDYAKFYMYEFSKGYLKFITKGSKDKLRIRNSFDSNEPTFAEVSARLKQEGIPFEGQVTSFVPPEKLGQIKCGPNLSFWFQASGKKFALKTSKLWFVGTVAWLKDLTEE